MGMLDGKVCVVTGGGRGIGSAICERFAREGGYVVISYGQSSDAARALLSKLENAGGHGEVWQADVAEAGALEELASHLYDTRERIDVWVNNAGITRDGLLLGMGDEDWQAVIDTNLNGVMRGTKAAAKIMMMEKSGSIINMSSIAAVHANRGQCNYAASKGAINSFTRALAVELARKKVRVNAIAPGFIETDMAKGVLAVAGDDLKKKIPLGRFGQPEDIAGAALFLASDLAQYMTGHVLTVDGGMSL